MCTALRSVLSLVLALLFGACGADSDPYAHLSGSAEKSPTARAVSGEASFEDHFVPVDTTHLSEDKLISSASVLDVDARGRFLVTDRQGREVLLYNSNGDLLRTLDPKPCHPGFQMQPFVAQFYPADGNILLINIAGVMGFRFDSEGECVGALDNEFAFTGQVSPAHDGHLYGFYQRPDEYFIRKMDEQGRAVTTFGHGSEFSHYIQRNIISGITSDGRGNVYLALPVSPHVYKFSATGDFAGRLGWQPSYYRMIDGDIAVEPGNTAQIAGEIDRKSREMSKTISIESLDADKLLVIYRNTYKYQQRPGEEMGIAVMDTSGRPLIAGDIQTNRRAWLHAARDGYAYRAMQPDRTEAGEVPNPFIVKYRFVPATDWAQ